MIISAASIPDQEIVDADICIVGAGPAGLTVAEAFEGTRYRVYVLEAGGEHPNPSPDVPSAESTGYPYFPLESARARVFGGSSYIWGEWMRARPLEHMDFEQRPWIPASGWPIGREELAPFYEEAHLRLGLNPKGYDVDEFAPGFGSLSWRRVHPVLFQYSNTADFTAKAQQFNASSNICVVLNASALEAVPAQHNSDRIDYVVVSHQNPQRFQVRAQVFVMAAGGVDNPKLLLSSRKRTPDGIGNQFDLVGRYFMEHPRLARGHVEWRDMDHLPLFKRVRLGDGASRIAFALSEETIRTEELLNCMALLTPSNVLAASETRRSLAIIRDRLRGDLESYDEPALSHVAALLARPLESARFGIALTRGKEAMRVHRVSLTVEQEPRPSSRVSLSQSLDAFGFPVPSLHWDLGDLEVRTMRALQEAMNGDLQDVGFGKVVGLLGDEVPRRRLRGEWHQMGTTRMGHTPRSGVVDPQGKVHGIANLFMAGGSVFPTVGYANPTLTIVALSLRLARHLGKALEGGPALGSFW